MKAEQKAVSRVDWWESSTVVTRADSMAPLTVGQWGAL